MMLKLAGDGSSVETSDGFGLKVTTGASTPIVREPHRAEIDLNSVDVVSSAPGGTLEIWVSDADFNLSGAPLGVPRSARTGVGGTATSSGDLMGLTFGGAATFNYNPSVALFSKATLDFTGPGVASFDGVTQDATLEPTSMILFGATLAALATLVRRRLAKKRI